MKKIVLFAGLAMSLCASFGSQAQVRVSVNIGTPVVQQSWYANDNDYYYMPEQGVYYNVRRRVYVYPEGGRWLYANQLPARYGNYSYRNSRYVQVRDRSPFNRDNDYRQRYQVNNSGGNRGGYGNGNNPHYNGRHDNGNHNGWDRNGRGNNGAQNNRNTQTDRTNAGNVDNNRDLRDTRGNRGNQTNLDRNNTNQNTNVNQNLDHQNNGGQNTNGQGHGRSR